MNNDNSIVLATSQGKGEVDVRRPFGVLGGFRAFISYPVRAVLSMPDLKEPVADPESLPENTNCVASAAAMTVWAWKMFEYKVEPTGKGFAAWLKLALLVTLFFVLPMGVLYCGSVMAGHLFGFTVEALKLTGGLSLLFLSIIVLFVLSYVIYAMVMILRGKPIRVPEIHIKTPTASESSSEGEIIDVTDVGTPRKDVEPIVS